MQKYEPIEHDKYYHIYNRGNNYENIFISDSDYANFLKLLNIYILPVAEILAWCLMKNHFHLLVRIKEENEIGFLIPKNRNIKDLAKKWAVFFPDSDTDTSTFKQPIPERQFKHLFNKYAKSFNVEHNRIGSLFIKNFERKSVDNEKYLKNLILYIHNNPVHHEFVNDLKNYYWSSYSSILSNKPTKIKRDFIISLFDNVSNFEFVHKQKMEFENIKHLIIE
jgi:REP element-mobilizing transposase RayT